MKQVSKLILLVIGGLMMVVLSGCDERNSREWLENKFGTELSRVYPTKNLEDLFEEFPDGFEIKQSSFTSEDKVRVTLEGNPATKQVEGVIVRTDRKTSEIVAEDYFTWKEGKYVYISGSNSSAIWRLNKFLVEEYSLNADYLSQLVIKDKSYNFQNGAFNIDYSLAHSELPEMLKKQFSEGATLSFGGSNSNQNYYYSVVFEDGAGNYFRETISANNK